MPMIRTASFMVQCAAAAVVWVVLCIESLRLFAHMSAVQCDARWTVFHGISFHSCDREHSCCIYVIVLLLCVMCVGFYFTNEGEEA